MVDETAEGFGQILGPDSYMATAPRVRTREELKRVIVEFEKGERGANPGSNNPRAMHEALMAILAEEAKTRPRKKGFFARLFGRREAEVGEKGLEPLPREGLEPKSSAATNYATRPFD